MDYFVIDAAGLNKLHLGVQGDDLVTAFDFSAFYADCERTYGAGALSLTHRRKGDADAYPVDLTADHKWIVTSADVRDHGTGAARLVYKVGAQTKHSLLYTTVVLEGETQTDVVPEAWQNYVDAVIAKVSEVENLGVIAETLAPDRPASVVKAIDPDGHITLKFGLPKGENGEDGASVTAELTETEDGVQLSVTDKNGTKTKLIKHGFTPTANVVETSDGAKISITDKNGTTIANVRNGKDGSSPVAKVEQTASGAKVSITDKDGTTTAIIKDGKDGDITTIVDFEMDDDGVLYYKTVSESTLAFNMYNGVLEVSYGN